MTLPPLVLGCIADDVTGATDIASTLANEGMRTVQVIGVPSSGFTRPDADAIVIALKSRTIEPAKAVEQSLESLRWLRGNGALHIFFKYCSTFDSTDKGNIGPVADALLTALRSDFTIACPAFPETGRRLVQGYLFVGDVLLSESPMRDHPLTPMRDPNLVRVLGRQTPHPVQLIDFQTVEAGPMALTTAGEKLRAQGVRHAIVDALSDRHLRDIGLAFFQLPLLTGGSGLARGLPEAYRRRGLLSERTSDHGLAATRGASAVLAGSCSAATLRQIAYHDRHYPCLALDPVRLADGPEERQNAVRWALERLDSRPLIYTSADPQVVARVQLELGKDRAAQVAEAALAEIACALVEAGVDKLVVAGGETSGAVAQALQVTALRIGAPIAPGVPWTSAIGKEPLALAFKSGNFGGDDFFTQALERAP